MFSVDTFAKFLSLAMDLFLSHIRKFARACVLKELCFTMEGSIANKESRVLQLYQFYPLGRDFFYNVAMVLRAFTFKSWDNFGSLYWRDR